MTTTAARAEELTLLLGLEHTPVGVSFDAADAAVGKVSAEPAGCCFWAPGQTQRIDTAAADHAHCSVGSYTHGFIPLEKAAAADDTSALVASGWVAGEDLMAAPALPFRPASVTYQPLAEAEKPDVVLVELTAAELMTLHSAVPHLMLSGKPQCVIVPLAAAGQVAVSPGCAVSRVRTGLSDDSLTCAIPADELEAVIGRLKASTAADRAVQDYARADIESNFTERS